MRVALSCLILLVASRPLVAETNFVVAADGSGDFKTVQEAIMAVPISASRNWSTIHIKPGVYKELIYVQRERGRIRLVGEDPEKTVLTYDLNANLPGPNGKPIGTFRTPSTMIDADDFIAENITFENSAGPVGQALAIRVDGDCVMFRNCRFLGWQDTILANRGRHYFENCYIAGHVDFIFGGATAFFDACHIHCLSNGYITAASTPPQQPYGFVFSNCKITGEAGAKTYLGRPWRSYGSVTFLNTEMSEVVRPEGWNNWKDPTREKTARYAEFHSTGPGADSSNRVAWARQLTEKEAKVITPEKVLDGWTPLRLKMTNATIGTDIEYGVAGGEKLLLDVCAPAGTGSFPVVIMVHGGGWTGGDKERDHIPILDALTVAKFTWFSINYRLAPKHRWPACFDDVETAVRWVKTHAAEYKGDPQHIALIGYSAGGQLVCMAAVRAKDEMRVQAIVGLAPPTDQVADSERRSGMSSSMTNLLDRASNKLDDDSRAVLRELSPINFIKPGLPPFLLVHGTEDKSVPYNQSVSFQAKLKDLSVPCQIATVQGAPHRLTEWSKFDASYRDKMIGWLKHILATGTAATNIATSPPDVKVKIVLLGDSTVNDAQGWGTAFKKQLKPGAACINWAKNGRSSKSFLNEGLWENALAEKPDYVLIQFGHNDMPGKGPDRETDAATTYPQYMARYVDEARAAGAKPILITSMTRRRFNAEGKIDSDLWPYVDAVKKLAEQKSVPLIDLHARSIEVLDKLGPKASEEFDPAPKPGQTSAKPDKTHLSPKGIEVMGQLVAEEFKKAEPDLSSYIQ